jgi:hypothetical protein
MEKLLSLRVSFSSHPTSTVSPPPPLQVPLSLFLKHLNVALISIKKVGAVVKGFFFEAVHKVVGT